MVWGVGVLGRKVHVVRGVEGDRLVLVAFGARGIGVFGGNVCRGIRGKGGKEGLPIWPKALVRGVAGGSDLVLVEIMVSSLARRASTSERRVRTVVMEAEGTWERGWVEAVVSCSGVGKREAEYFGWDLERDSEGRGGCRGMGRVVCLPLDSREAGGRPLVGRDGEGVEGGGEDSALESEGVLDVEEEGLLVDGTNESNGRAMGGGGWKRKMVAVTQSWMLSR